jgi:hypothetical protein
LLELGALREAIVGVEDPRYGQLRLLPEHDVFFEFIPADASTQQAPPRLGVEQIEVGVPYEMVLTSAAGVWACRAGVSVQFERLDPALFSFIGTATAQPSVTPQPSRQQSDGIPAMPPGSFGHTPWLAPADRG